MVEKLLQKNTENINSYDFNQIFTNKLNFSIKLPVKELVCC